MATLNPANNPSPINPKPPGGVGDSKKYPQWGLNPSNGKTIEAKDEQEKLKDIKAGYVDWFVSDDAAKNAYKGMKGFGSGNVGNPLSGIDSIGASIEAFYDTITDGKLWRSIGWIVLGMMLLMTGLYLWFRGSSLYKSAEGSFGDIVKKAP